VRTLIATTALALILGGPAVAQTQDQTQQQQQDQVATQDQMMAGGYYQPQQNDILIANLMDAQVYAPAQGQAMQQPGMDQQATDPAVEEHQEEQMQAADPAQQPDDVATDPGAEPQPADQVADDPAAQPADQQVAQDPAQDPAMQPQDQQMMAGTGQIQSRTVTQDELGQMENIGAVEDMILGQDGELKAVVVNVGGFLGMGARSVALDVQQVELARDQQDPSQHFIITQVGADTLENAPEFDRAMIEDGQQMQQEGELQQQDQQPVATTTTTAQDPAAQEQDGQWRQRDAMAAPAMEREGYQQAQAGEFAADDLIGANVYDINDENIGSVDDIVLGQDGSAQYAVVDVGGFLGFGTHTVAIGFDEMSVMHDEGWADVRVYVDVTQDQLEQMPEYEGTATQ
jgi:sporulation protein YlmC with PRC-barrel domain